MRRPSGGGTFTGLEEETFEHARKVEARPALADNGIGGQGPGRQRVHGGEGGEGIPEDHQNPRVGAFGHPSGGRHDVVGETIRYPPDPAVPLGSPMPAVIEHQYLVAARHQQLRGAQRRRFALADAMPQHSDPTRIGADEPASETMPVAGSYRLLREGQAEVAGVLVRAAPRRMQDQVGEDPTQRILKSCHNVTSSLTPAQSAAATGTIIIETPSQHRSIAFSPGRARTRSSGVPRYPCQRCPHAPRSLG